MKKISLLLLFCLCISVVFAQDETEEKPDARPVYMPFESGMLITAQSAYVPDAKTLVFVLDHRFGGVGNGIDDMFGLYAPSNIRLGLNYSLTNDLMVGFGATKRRNLTDFRLKWNILNQTRSNSVPLTITLFGDMAIDGRNADVYGNDYKFMNRYSYFAQVIFAKKFTEFTSLQFAPSYSHINSVEQGFEHDQFAVTLSGRFKFSTQSSIVFNYDFPLHITKFKENKSPEAFKSENSFSIGWEIATGTHVFQIFLAANDNLSPQHDMMLNDIKFGTKSMVIGFSITRLWGF
jgi:hypothetical protein